MIDKSKEYPYSGIPTFLKSDYGPIDQLPNYQVGVFGVPMDIGVSNRTGTNLGPAAIRKASTYYNPQTFFEKGTFIDLFQRQKQIEAKIPKILDLGDVTTHPTNFQKTIQSIQDFSSEVSKKAFPIILGGDHSLTYPAVKGFIEGIQYRETVNNLGIIHFDSHPDIWDSHITLEDIWHGSPFRKLLDEKIIEGKNLMMIGDRTILSQDEYNYIKSKGVSLYSISDIWEKGIDKIMLEACTSLKETSDGIYVSLDIDVMDPCYAPETGTPVPGGLTPKEMITAINIICESSRLMGIDLVEVAPGLGQTENTQNLAAFFLHRFLLLCQNF